MGRFAFRLAAFTLLCPLSLSAEVVPLNLPRPDASPPTTTKPVKVYILSGQSNMVGFGAVDGGGPTYSSLILSADPSVMPCRMPVGASALLPHGIYVSATDATPGAIAAVYRGDYDPDADYDTLQPVEQSTVALGAVGELLPAIDGPHTVVVRGFIEVPMAGPHEVHAGFGDSAHALVVLDGKPVYRRDPGGEAVLNRIELESGRRYPLTITYFKGGSLAFWMERVDLQPRGTLRALVNEGKYPWLVDDSGQWIARPDVIVNDAYVGKGQSKPLQPTMRGNAFGPELGFGHVMGTFHDEPVLLIKADMGNRSLGWDILPPGSERFEVDGRIYAGYKDTQASWPKEQGEPRPGGWYAGKQYDEFTEAIHRELEAFGDKYPQFKDQGYEIAGFVWWQGHKDQNPVYASRYEQNLVNLIHAWRKEFDAPDAKWVIATIAFGGWALDGPGRAVAEAQLAVDGDSGRHPAFKGNVRTVEVRDFWRGIGESPKAQDYHYNHNAETYLLVGDALGRAMVELHGGQAQWRPPAARRAGEDRVWPKNPTLAEALEMVYSDAFIADWIRNDAEPTDQQREAMRPALQPIILDKLIPEYVALTLGPSHWRGGLSMINTVSNEPPQKRTASLQSQFDQLISLYNAADIHAYDWRPFGPPMRTATWHYLSFDPPEKQDTAKAGRNRPITYPPGAERWYAVDFDASAAGWGSGAAPFGQVDGRLAPLRQSCSDPQCRCDMTPATLWEHEVLLMRQTFDLPPLDPRRRYRLVVGGASHPWSGEGFSVYVNGRLFAEAREGHYKGNGGDRGSYVFNDFLPEFASGRVTIAVQGFLRYTGHRNQEAPPRGHLSVWLEEAPLPPALEQAAAAKGR